MAQVTIYNKSALDVDIECDIVFTDPPFDMTGNELALILNKIKCDHLILLTTMKQLLEFMEVSNWVLSFDFILDSVVPKKSKNIRQPNYIHVNGVYLTRNKAKSIFNRKLRQRSDSFDNNGYWPSIIRSPRNKMDEHGLAKNEMAITDVLGSFDVQHVYDPFCGSGTIGFACVELGLKCTLTEIDKDVFNETQKQFKFLGVV